MAILPPAPKPTEATRKRVFGRINLIFLSVMTALLVLSLILSWTTRDAMEHLPFLSGPGAHSHQAKKTLVDLRPWQTIEALAPLAVTAEETEHAHEAERLADHEVGQAFAAALRMASVQAQHRTLTGQALALSQRVDQLQELVKEDEAQVKSLTAAMATPASKGKDSVQPNQASDDLDVAKAQLGLDSDQLADAQRDLDRVSGDDRAQIQAELAAHEAVMRKFDSDAKGNGEVAVISVKHHGTLASRLVAWKNQHDRSTLIQQAMQQAQADIASLTAARNALDAKDSASANVTAQAGASQDRAAKLASIVEKGQRRQLLAIENDRIATQQQLADVYAKWAAQVMLQHRILAHLIQQSLALIAFICICIILCDALVRKLLANPALDRRQMQTLRSVSQLAIQTVGALLVLLVIFGWPDQMSTILGLATAGLTIVMQDFILAFFGWFVLMGKNGIRLGDWVEINGVGGEVTEIGLMSTTLLETGDLTERGHPTGRRITILNSFAIRGQYFNFSTTGQWMWDEIDLDIPPSINTQEVVERIHKAVEEETKTNSSIAEQEWKRGSRGDGLSRFSAKPTVNLRPSGIGVEVQVRYVTRASERFGVRNRLYKIALGLLHNDSDQHAVVPPHETV
jgi:small-conductance mechanosensitive channel